VAFVAVQFRVMLKTLPALRLPTESTAWMVILFCLPFAKAGLMCQLVVPVAVFVAPLPT
jgi:hypothetical protein